MVSFSLEEEENENSLEVEAVECTFGYTFLKLALD